VPGYDRIVLRDISNKLQLEKRREGKRKRT
jgi:hypothetical protein